jgi:hypothetical protein
MTFIHFRVEHGYTMGRVFPHHTRTCKHCTCTRNIPYQLVNNVVPFETRGITLTHSILVIKITKITIITEMLYYNIVFKGDGEMRDGSCHLYLLSKKNQQKKTPKRGMGGRSVAIAISCRCRCCCGPTGVACMPALCICVHPPFPPFVCPCACLHLSTPALAFGCMCDCVLVYAGSH